MAAKASFISRRPKLTDLVISTAASVPVIVGIMLVRPLRDKLPPGAFRILVLLFVLAAAFQMIWKSRVL